MKKTYHNVYFIGIGGIGMSAIALWVWWSSATLGEGTNTAAFSAAQISDTEEAPARLMSTSAQA